jgi:hypothetical protein
MKMSVSVPSAYSCNSCLLNWKVHEVAAEASDEDFMEILLG